MGKTICLSSAQINTPSGTTYASNVYDLDGVMTEQVRRVSPCDETGYHYALRQDPSHPWEIYRNGAFRLAFDPSDKPAAVAAGLERLDSAAKLTRTNGIN